MLHTHDCAQKPSLASASYSAASGACLQSGSSDGDWRDDPAMVAGRLAAAAQRERLNHALKHGLKVVVDCSMHPDARDKEVGKE